MAEKEIVMNGAGIEEIGFPMWPQFAPETMEDVLEPIKNGKVSYWTGTKGMEFEEKFAKWCGANLYNNECFEFKSAKDMEVIKFEIRNGVRS